MRMMIPVPARHCDTSITCRVCHCIVIVCVFAATRVRRWFAWYDVEISVFTFQYIESRYARIRISYSGTTLLITVRYTPCSTSRSLHLQRSGEARFRDPPPRSAGLSTTTTKVTRIHLTRREKVQSSDGRAPPPRAGLRFTNRSNAKSEEVAGSRSAVPPIPALPPADGRAWPRVLLGSLQSRQASSPGSLRALLACVEAGASCFQTSCCV